MSGEAESSSSLGNGGEGELQLIARLPWAGENTSDQRPEPRIVISADREAGQNFPFIAKRPTCEQSRFVG